MNEEWLKTSKPKPFESSVILAGLRFSAVWAAVCASLLFVTLVAFAILANGATTYGALGWVGHVGGLLWIEVVLFVWIGVILDSVLFGAREISIVPEGLRVRTTARGWRTISNDQLYRPVADRGWMGAVLRYRDGSRDKVVQIPRVFVRKITSLPFYSNLRVYPPVARRQANHREAGPLSRKR